MNKVFKQSIKQSNLQTQQNKKQIRDFKERLCINQDLNYHWRDVELDFSIIFSTSKGVFILDAVNKVFKQILTGKFYGITKHKGFWYFARLGTEGKREFPVNNRVSEIYYGKILGHEILDLQLALYGIPAELHQIDSIKDCLTFPHTGYNQILNIPFSEIQGAKEPLEIKDCNSTELNLNEHSHLNSIFYNNNSMYVIAHNYTMKTNKMSDLIKYDLRTKQQEVMRLEAHSAHNIHIDNENNLLYCDSNNKKLVKNNKVLFERDKLFRGLLITDNNIFLGGSDICFKNDQRFSNNPSIYLLNLEGDLLNEFEFEALGDIYEIRQFKV